jgi:uncharacterized protein with GYD domain
MPRSRRREMKAIGPATIRRRQHMFTYLALVQLTAEGRENLTKAPEYLDKIKVLIEEEGGLLEQTFATMGPWDFFAIVKYPTIEAAFRAHAKIAMLEVVQTETFPAEEVEVFLKAFV